MSLLEIPSGEHVVLSTEHVFLNLVESKLVAAVKEHPLSLLVPHLVELIVKSFHYVLRLNSRLKDYQLTWAHLLLLLLMNREVWHVVIIFVSLSLGFLFGVLNIRLLDDKSCEVLGQVVLVLFAYCCLSVSIPIAPRLLLPTFNKLFISFLILKLIVLGSIDLKASLDKPLVCL